MNNSAQLGAQIKGSEFPPNSKLRLFSPAFFSARLGLPLWTTHLCTTVLLFPSALLLYQAVVEVRRPST